MLRPKGPPLSIDCMICGAKMTLTAVEPGTIELCTPTAARRRISNSWALRSPDVPGFPPVDTSFVRAGWVGTCVGDAIATPPIGSSAPFCHRSCLSVDALEHHSEGLTPVDRGVGCPFEGGANLIPDGLPLLAMAAQMEFG
jgi:hypothetical protein